MENRYLAHRDEHGKLREIESIVIDVTERKASEQKIELLARTDFLTGLANRATFLERLTQAFAATTRGHHPFAILYLDLDSFKSVNDTLGHGAGDELLRTVADRLRLCTRTTDLVARLGGDEFAILQSEVSEAASAGVLAAKIQRALSVPYPLAAGEVHSSVSIGICLHAADSSGPDAMLAQADIALYRSKQEGRNQYRFYSEEIDREVLGRVKLAEDLKLALGDHQGELEFFFQPETDMFTGERVDVKASVRWHHPTHGLLNASDFVPALEKSASGAALADWLLDKACAEMNRRSAESPLGLVAIDVRFSQLKHGDEFVASITAALEKWKLAPSTLELDVTELTLAQVCLSENDTLARLHEVGVAIAIADFGDGYCLLEYVRAFDVKRFKLSEPFIAGALVSAERKVVLRSLVQFAKEIGIGIVAEGRHTREQRDLFGDPGTNEHATADGLVTAVQNLGLGTTSLPVKA
jgi:diguanylate cyclase (GGDEF)-like protein